jgi:hypothetical protein
VNVSSTITSGRIVKTTGDGILIEFPSVVEAVACAIEVQRGMAARDDATAEDQRIKFRVGINSRNGFAWTHRWREPDSNYQSPPEILVDPSGSRRDHRAKYECLSARPRV